MKKAILFVVIALLLIGILGISVFAKGGSIEEERENAVDAAKDARKAVIEAEEETIKEAVREAKKEIKGAREDLKEEIKELKEKIKKFKEKIRENDGWLEIEGETIKVKELSNEIKEIIAGRINARTGLNLTAEDISNGTAGQILRAYMSNGRYAIIKVMPDRAAETALKILKAKCDERNCTVELKEVSVEKNKTRIVYEVETEKGSRIFFIFGKKMRVKAQVDAETGEIIIIKKPWWAFIAKEDDSKDSEIENELADENTGKKVVICHVPPGNAANAKTIKIGQAALEAHLSHGDYKGECVGVGIGQNNTMVNNTIINNTVIGNTTEDRNNTGNNLDTIY